MTDTTSMTDDERRNRDTQSWLEITIARRDGVPGQGKAVDNMRHELVALRRQAKARGWSTVAPTRYERMMDRIRDREPVELIG